ncbi:hypothetical protein [Vibrio sp. Y58_MX_L22]|uniref:hypothetical protein n=1 Tax=Vibrio sp. Y58_MX_L22 TaxID=2957763 RepID=UPI0020A3EB29|nr:hypothetical protein [Vibrio sp. Y58_MX_L22]
MEMTPNTTCYVMLSKRYLSRYVLTYELLPLEYCFDVNGQKVFDHTTMHSLVNKGKVGDKNVVVGLTQNLGGSYLPYCHISDIGFTNQDSLGMFVERSYENYDSRTINCRILTSNNESSELTLDIVEPPTVDKHAFTLKMALNDAIIAATHSHLLTHPQFTTELSNYLGNADQLLNAILTSYLEDTNQLVVAIEFFKVCSKFNIDTGWQLIEVVEELKKNLPPEANSDDVKRWFETAQRIINNEDVNLIYSDDKNIALRAMILVLLNPEKDNINAMKVSLQEHLGEKVYSLANIFVGARAGYSYLSVEQRNMLADRTQLQLLNASLYNHASDELTSEPIEQIPTQEQISPDENKFILEQEPWLKRASPDIFQLCAVKPMAGFDLSLEYEPESFLAWRLIDANGTKGMEKLKGQLALNLLLLQGKLPVGVRIEVIQDRGLYINLPLVWAKEADLKNKLQYILDELIAIKIAQKSSKLVVN